MSEEKKTVLAEFVEKWLLIEAEQRMLAEDKKTLVSEFKDKLDVKTVQTAMRLVKMKAKLDVSDDEFDTVVNSLERHMSL